MQTPTLNHIPSLPGVYFFKESGGKILYIGKAKNLSKRLSQYFAPGSVWKQDMLSKAEGFDFMITETEHEALMLEDNLIKKHQPIYNRLLKADNSYVYIKITKGNWPQIFLTRQRNDDGSTYIGPKSNRGLLVKLLQYFRQLYGYRGCKTTQFNQGKICSDYLFGICKGRCVMSKLKQKNAEDYLQAACSLGFDPTTTYESGVSSSHHMIKSIESFFKGHTEHIEKDLKKGIEDCIHSQNFEWAAKLRDIYHNISSFVEQQRVVLDSLISGNFCLVTLLGSRWVIIVITFTKGKLVDIIRLKEHSGEVDMDYILRGISGEYGDQIIKQLSDNRYFIHTSSQKKLTKQITTTIQTHLDNALDSYIQSESIQSHSVMNDLLGELQTRYSFKRYPYTIECIDISHLSGGYASGALTHMQGGILHKGGYRQYRIDEKHAGDDYKSLSEVLIRRFQLTHQGGIDLSLCPDLFIIDGGVGQLGILKKIAQKYPYFQTIIDHVQFCGLGKGDARHSGAKIAGATEELYTVQADGSFVSKEFIYDNSDRLLIQLRNEAHRFSNKYRTKQMSQQRTDKPTQRKEKQSS